MDRVETTGAASVVHVELAGQRIQIFTMERLHLTQGERVPLDISASHICLFDPAIGDRLR